MASLLVHITHGPEAPSRAALGMLVARTALSEGHDVTVFLAADGVQMIRDSVLDATQGVGIGSAREHFDAIASGGGRFYVSKMSSTARGVTEADLDGKPAQFATPNDLVRVTLESDRALTY
ncbi:MAG TPA: DsrE family protein [Actinomycetota bacterium]|nr:DsrE family protein [Actinomycetota bacterium]